MCAFASFLKYVFLSVLLICILVCFQFSIFNPNLGKIILSFFLTIHQHFQLIKYLKQFLIQKIHMAVKLNC